MGQRYWAARCLALPLVALTVAFPLLITAVRAVEDAAAFTEALRKRNKFDLVVEYLRARQSSEIVSEAFRARIPYELGITLIEQAQRTSDATARAALLQAAQQHLVDFATANPDSDSGGAARLQLAQVLLERGRQDIARAEGKGDGQATERQTLLEAARTVLNEAQTQFAMAQEYYNVARKQFPTNLDVRIDAEKIERRDEYRRQWLTAWFYSARIPYETARTYPANSEEFRQLNLDAAQKLADLHQKYHTRLVGLTAHLYEGRALQAIAELGKAIGCFEDLVIQSDGPPEFRLLIAQAYTGLAECLLQQDKPDEVIERCEAWLRVATSDELAQPDWLAVRFLVAKAKLQKSTSLEEGSPQRNKLRREAREEFKLIAREPSPLRREAQQEFVALTSRTANDRSAAEIRDVDEAFQLGRDAFDEMTAHAGQAAAATDPDKVSELEEAASECRQRAQAFFRRTIVLAASAVEADLEQLNSARYYLAWLAYQDEDYLRAAVLGEFLVRRYPDSRPARDGAKIAMSAYQQLFREAEDTETDRDDRNVEVRRMADIADFIVRLWPDSEDAAQAQEMLVSFAVRTGRLDEAKALLADVEPERRLQAELRVANGLWAEFLRVRRSQESDSQVDEATARLRDEAQKRLQAAFSEAVNSNTVSVLAATTGLYLTQAHLLSEDYPAAIGVLENATLGPFQLAVTGHASVSGTDFLVEAMKSALQAYVLTSPPQRDKVTQAIDVLENTLGSSPEGAAKTTQIYLGLGLRLQQRLEDLQATGRSEEARQIATVFAEILDRVADRDAASNWSSLLWIAQTYLNVGKSMGPPGQPSSHAELLFEKSLEAYDKLLIHAEQDRDFAPDERAVLAVRKRKADVLRELGRFRDAMDIYSGILAKNKMMLDVQRDAAYTYQLWGELDPRRFENAIHGGRRVKSTGENRVWGWLDLSKIAAQAARQDAKYRNWYFEARLNAAKSRFLAANATRGQQKTSQLLQAKNAVRALHQLYPELGGPEWQEQFSDLLKQIQSALEQRPVGLQEFAGP